MAEKSLDLYRDYLIQEHGKGKTAAELARQFGVTDKVVVRVLGAAYTPIGRPANLPVEEVVKMYLSGTSENVIAKKHGVSRRAVSRVLQLASVPRRSQSEAETLKWAALNKRQRAVRMAAAHEASRGRPIAILQLIKTAITRSLSKDPCNVSIYEKALQSMLRSRGIICKPQLPIGPYNCDLAAEPVTVEVWGGNWHFSGRHIARVNKRFHYLMDAGWNILVVCLGKTRFPLTTAVADYVAAYIEEARRNPPPIRQYRVVWGASEFSTGGTAEDDEITVIPPFTGRRDPATGQYQTVPRQA